MYADVFSGGQNYTAPLCTIVRWRRRYRLGLLVTASSVGDGALEFRVAEDPAFRPMCDMRVYANKLVHPQGRLLAYASIIRIVRFSS